MFEQDTSFLDGLKGSVLDLLNTANDSLRRRLARDGPTLPPAYDPTGTPVTASSANNADWLPYVVAGGILAFVFFKGKR